jgi:hypothetical protein
MVWVKIDDHFHAHPKVAALEPDLMGEAVCLHALALSWCGDALTDGLIPKGQPARLRGRPVENVIAELLRVGLWERSGDGYQIHDYLDYNFSKAQVGAASRARSAGGRRGAEARWGSGNDGLSHGLTDSLGHGSAHSLAHGVPNGLTIASGCPEPVPVLRKGPPLPPQEEDTGADAHALGLTPPAPGVWLKEFHARCPSLPRVTKLEAPRRRRLLKLVKELGPDGIAAFFDRIEASDFLTGRLATDRNWRADFDWITKPANVTRILEGIHDNRRPAGKPVPNTFPPPEPPMTEEQKAENARAAKESFERVKQLGAGIGQPI